MNELMNNFINQIEDVNKIREMSVEEFTKLVKANKLISEDDAKQLIESFKKISSKKTDEDDANDSDQRKKKYRDQHKETTQHEVAKQERVTEEREDNSIER